MATTPKILGDGQLAAATASIYTVPAATTAIVRLITFQHVAGGTQTVNLWIKESGGTLRKVARAVLAADEFAHEDGIETLGPGDEIHADTTNAASVDYMVLGVEQT